MLDCCPLQVVVTGPPRSCRVLWDEENEKLIPDGDDLPFNITAVQSAHNPRDIYLLCRRLRAPPLKQVQARSTDPTDSPD